MLLKGFAITLADSNGLLVSSETTPVIVRDCEKVRVVKKKSIRILNIK